MLDVIKKQLLKYQFVQNYFREKRGWPLLSKGPKGKSIRVVNPHWDDAIIACYGTLSKVTGNITIDSNHDTIFIPAPWDDHPDHVEASKISIRNDAEVWCYQVYMPMTTNVVVDITDVMREKAEALRQVNMQTNDRDWKHYALGRDAYAARHLHMKGKRYAELFLVLPAKQYIEFRKEFFACCKS